MSAPRIAVLKFGGTSFRTLKDYTAVAAEVIHRRRVDADKVVVVVSAMYGVTNKLREAACEIAVQPRGPCLDAVMTAGETVSANLLALALSQHGIVCQCLTAYELGIRTDDTFGNAAVLNAEPDRLERALQAAEVVVATGAQGLTAAGRPAMLGRNSSDYSATVICGICGVAEVNIFSDVPGIYSADPTVVSDAIMHQRIDYDRVLEMARRGARVLHPNAVRAAREHGIRIVCRDVRDPRRIGTVIGSQGSSPPAVVQLRNVSIVRSSRREKLEDLRVEMRERCAMFIVSHHGQPTLVLDSSQFDVLHQLDQRGFHMERYSGKTLVSLLQSSGEPQAFLAHDKEADQLTIQLHNHLIRPKTATPAGVAREGAGTKRLDCDSGPPLLLAG